MFWSRDLIEQARDQYVQRIGYDEISADLAVKVGHPVSADSIKRQLQRHYPMLLAERADERKAEISARHARMRALYREGLSITEVAATLGIPRGTVGDVICQDAKPQLRWCDIFGPPWALQCEPCPELEPQVVHEGKLLVDLDALECRWPIGRDEDKNYRFCGCEIGSGKRGSAYCDAHEARSRNHRPGRQEDRARKNSSLPTVRVATKIRGDAMGVHILDPWAEIGAQA